MKVKKHVQDAVSREVVLYKSYTIKAGPGKGKFPVRLRITHQRKSRYYPVLLADRSKLFLDKEGFKSLDKKKFAGIKSITTAIYARAGEAIDKITRDGGLFSFVAFEAEFLHQVSKKTFYTLFEDYLKKLDKAGRAGTFLSYQNVLNVMRTYKKELRAETITIEWLEDFEDYLLKPHPVGKGKGKGTRLSVCTPGGVGVYMRTIKAVYNYAISQNPDLRNNYPFTRDGVKKYSPPPTGRAHKGGIFTEDEIHKFAAIKTELHSPEWEAQQYFILSYLLNGLNFTDICRIEYQNVSLEKKTLVIIREKTKRTAPEKRIIELNDNVIKLIQAITAIPGRMRSTVYLFPILPPGLTEVEQKETIHGFIKRTNKYIVRLCERANLPIVSTYAARHSSAVHQYNAGVDLLRISKNLDHRNLNTTQRYLDHWNPKKAKDASDVLTSNIFRAG